MAGKLASFSRPWLHLGRFFLSKESLQQNGSQKSTRRMILNNQTHWWVILNPKHSNHLSSRWWFILYIFVVHPEHWGKWFPFRRSYFSKGLKPPTSWVFGRDIIFLAEGWSWDDVVYFWVGLGWWFCNNIMKSWDVVGCETPVVACGVSRVFFKSIGFHNWATGRRIRSLWCQPTGFAVSGPIGILDGGSSQIIWLPAEKHSS